MVWAAIKAVGSAYLKNKAVKKIGSFVSGDKSGGLGVDYNPNQQGAYSGNYLKLLDHPWAGTAIKARWDKKQTDTAYQRTMADMKKAGLNPILAAKLGGAASAVMEPLGGVINSAIHPKHCLLYTSPSPRDRTRSRMPSSA